MSKSPRKWVALELSHQGEKRLPQELYAMLRAEMGEEADIFVPAATFTRRDTTVTICLMEGYVFVEAGLPSSRYFDLEALSVIRRALSRDESAGRYLCYIEDHVIQDLRARLKEQTRRDVQVGDYVEICDGAYSALRGRILDVFEDRQRASIHIVDLKSMEVIVDLPFQFFERIEGELVPL